MEFLNFNFLKIFFYWPSEGLKSLKSICWLPVSLIDKRKVICDHSHLVNIIVYFGRIFVYFLGEIFVDNFDRGLNLTYKIFLAFKMAWNFKVNLPASCTSDWQKELNLWSHYKYLKKIRLPSQCKVSKKWWSIDQDEWTNSSISLDLRVRSWRSSSTSSSSTGSTRISWSIVRRFVETDDQFFQSQYFQV